MGIRCSKPGVDVSVSEVNLCLTPWKPRLPGTERLFLVFDYRYERYFEIYGAARYYVVYMADAALSPECAHGQVHSGRYTECVPGPGNLAVCTVRCIQGCVQGCVQGGYTDTCVHAVTDTCVPTYTAVYCRYCRYVPLMPLHAVTDWCRTDAETLMPHWRWDTDAAPHWA